MQTNPRPKRQEIRLSRPQRLFRQSNAIYRGFCAGISSGKTWVGAYDLIRRAKPGRLYMLAAPSYKMLADASERMLLQCARDLGYLKHHHKSDRIITLGNDAEILCRSTDNPESSRGPNLSGVWMDEASLHQEEAWRILIGRLREGGEQGWLSATFTPKGRTHWTYREFATKKPDTDLIHCRTKDNPFAPPGFADRLSRYYTGAYGRQELDGDFLDCDDDCQVIPTAWIRAAQERWRPEGRTEPLSAIGIDVARGGSAQTVLARRYGYWFAPLEKHPGVTTPDGPSIANLVYMASRENPNAIFNLDCIGVGSSAFDYCRGIKDINVYGINFAASTTAVDRGGCIRFKNKRALAYWSLRELLDPNNPPEEWISLPPDDEILEDLAAPRWMHTVGGLQIEDKTEITKRLNRSPDSGDAIAYAIMLPGADELVAA